jgi:hypothetical protein
MCQCEIALHYFEYLSVDIISTSHPVTVFGITEWRDEVPILASDSWKIRRLQKGWGMSRAKIGFLTKFDLFHFKLWKKVSGIVF